MNNELICTPVMLPGDGPVSKDRDTDILSVRKMKSYVEGFHQHLYLVEDRMPKKGEWYFNQDRITQNTLEETDLPPYWKTVVATTDKSLSLPLIPSSFIEEYVAKQGRIDKVRLFLPQEAHLHAIYGDERYLEVIILPIEDKMLSEARVIALMAATAHHVRKNGYGPWSISHGLARELYERWENKASEDHVPILLEDKTFSRAEVKKIIRDYENQELNGSKYVRPGHTDEWFDKHY